MSERIADPSVVCPFVAFDDDRDFRSPVPDHRHRCFAESPAAPRALAHQAAYCLSASFPGCPTFVDWARREAAPPKVESPVRSLRGPAAAPRAPAGSAPAQGAPVGPEPASDRPAEPTPRRDGDWTAPPPWAAAAAPAAGAAAAGRASGGDVGDELDAASGDLGAGRATAAAGLTDGLAQPAAPPPDTRPAPPPPPADAPAFLAGRSGRPGAPSPTYPDDEPWDAGTAADERYEEPPSRPAVAAPRRMPVGYAPVAAGSERVAGGSRRERSDPAAPSWEQPRRSESYPTLRSRGGGIPRPALYALVVLLVGIALFATPALLRGLGGGGDGASPTPAASASVAPTTEPSPTPVPTPAQVVHTVKSGDTLSKIAAQYGVTVDQILEANPKITNPNSIAIGDQIVIPQPQPSEIVNSDITPAP